MEIKVHNAIFNEIEVQNEMEVSSNLWISLSNDIYSHSKKNLMHIICDATSRSPLYTTMKRDRLGNGKKGLWLATFKR